mgnify:FL=1|tara:strand:+ start:6103 stop:6561 length:459 start_codon:yes stop_codon:yes gene_type:complete
MKTVIVSGYMNPLHTGHLSLFKEAASLGDRLIVIVNSDSQVAMKGSTPFMDAASRLEIVKELRCVYNAIISIDEDGSVTESISRIRRTYPDDEMVFANGGDRNPDNHVSSEVQYCIGNDISLAYGVGCSKTESSSRLIENATKNKITEWGTH